MSAAPPPRIRLRVLGPVSVEPPVNGALRLAVLLYLTLARPRGLHARDTLIGLLWPEADQTGGRHALRNALHALRQALGADAIVTSGDGLVGVDTREIDCDALELEADVAAGRVEDAIARYHGELLQGFYVSQAPEFEHWLDGERRRLAELVQKAAWAHAESLRAAGESERAAEAASRASALAPDDEISLRRLLRFLDDGGDRAGAIRAYDEFAERLRDELDAEPSAETQALAQSLREPPTTEDLRAAAPASRKATTRGSSVESGFAGSAMPVSPSLVWSRAARRSIRRRMLAASLASVAIVATTLAVRSRGIATPSATRLPIAVLPFVNDVGDTALAYVAPALSGSIADGLGTPAALPYDVTADLDPRDSGSVHRRLVDRQARVAVLGTLGGRRDSLELELRLASLDGEVLRSWRIRGSEQQLAALRDAALGAIRAATGAPNPPAALHVPDPEASRLALNAAWLLSRRTEPALRKALELYNRALEIDPDWTELWLGRSRVYGSIAYRHWMNYRDGMRASERDANEVLKRDPKDARAYMERAMARLHLGDLANARNDALFAEAIDSTDDHMQSLIGTWWQWTGDHLDSALFYTRRAERLNPSDRQVALNILEIVGCMPDSETILRAADHVLEMDPGEPYALEVRAWTLTRFGRWNEAAETYEHRYAEYVRRGVTARARRLSGQMRFHETVRALRRAVYADSGAGQPGERLVEDRIKLFEDLGWRDSSIAALNAVVDSLEVHRTNMMCGENLRDFRRDPRVQDIVRRRGWLPGEFGPRGH